ncbi:hypothetical protein [Chromobacterium alticapitis]|uniref:hypothetical protein n=1 Tax=Chromobacterium alticapitis TaxID=2073169 RepID=UPI0011AFD8DD|nr:hypothetical protein [Chromobacterium alticapitis]
MLITQTGANYFDGASKLALASKSVPLKKHDREIGQGGHQGRRGEPAGDLDYRSTAWHRSGGYGGRGAHFTLDKIDQRLEMPCNCNKKQLGRNKKACPKASIKPHPNCYK